MVPITPVREYANNNPKTLEGNVSNGNSYNKIPRSFDILLSQLEEGEKPKVVQKGFDANTPRPTDLALEPKEKVLESSTEMPEKIIPQNKIVFSDSDFDKFRNEYIRQLIEWKDLVRRKKELFAKSLSNFGVDKQLPEMPESKELFDARNIYLKALESKRQNSNVKDLSALLEMSEKESNFIQKRFVDLMPASERGIVTKTYEKWQKLPMYGKVNLSSILISGNTFTFGARPTEGVESYAGYRAPKIAPLSPATPVNSKFVDGIYKKKPAQDDSLDNAEVITPAINLNNFEQKEKEVTDLILKEEDEKKKDLLVKATSIIGDTEAVLTEKKEENNSVIEKHIPLEDGKFINVMKIDGHTGFLYNDISIAHEEVYGDVKVMVLDNQFQDGEKYKEVRHAFTVAFEQTAKVDSLGPSPFIENFEGGKIYIAYKIPSNPEVISILLNGKEIARGAFNNGNPTLKINPELKGSWFLADNVYERAYKHIYGMIKRKAFNFVG